MPDLFITATPRTWHLGTHGRDLDGGGDAPGVQPIRTAFKPRQVKSLFGRMQTPGPVPYISQLNQGHWNDESNCGPTCLAMIGQALGIIPDGDTDLSAIDAAGRLGHTRESGTSAYGLGQIAEAMGLDYQQTPGVMPSRIEQQLGQGALLVVKGNAFALPWRDDPTKKSGHVVLVIGQDDQGRFLINDPLDTGGQSRAVTAEELARFGQPASYRDRAFTMAVGQLSGPVYCHELLPGTPRT